MASRTRRHHRETMSSPGSRRKVSKEGNSFNSSYRDSSAIYDSDSEPEKENQCYDETDDANLTYEVDVVADRSPVRRKQRIVVSSPQETKISPRRPLRSSPGEKLSPTRKSPRQHDSSGEVPSPGRSFGYQRSVYSEDASPRYDRSSLSGESFSSSRTSTPVRKKKPEGGSQNEEDMMQYVIYFVAALLVAYMGWSIVSLAWPSRKQNVGTQTPTLKNEVVLKKFESNLAQVKDQFPAQSKRFWATLGAATKRVIKDENPIQPAVIILAAPEGTLTTANCILRHFLTAITNAHESVPALEINITSKYNGWNPHEAKMDLDNVLNSALESGSKAVGVYHLEDLHPVPASLLHGYCDNENAPFKDVALVFSVHMKDVAPLTSSPGDALLEEYLDKLWGKELEVDNLSALLSRLANNVALVKPEDMETVKKYC